MNLIEQLGGYEHLNGFYKRAVAHGFTLTEIKDALLQYRRQHNIFEVGDLVVSKNGCELVSEITYLQGGLAKIKNEKFDHVYSLQDFRHAEPEEIKAGKRLEVNQ